MTTGGPDADGMADRPARDTYTFGDTTTAAGRLELLARVFAPASRELLARWSPAVPERALDLGCGPGHTTRLVHEVTGAHRTVGVERSPVHLRRARSAQVPGVSYAAADVTADDLPGTPADLVFARFLLTHLADPAGALARWVRALRPGGRLLVQETARIASADPTFARYYELVDALQRHHGQDLTVGQRLATLASEAGLDVVHAGRRRLEVPVAAMARLHATNVRTWRDDEHARTAFDADELDELTLRLDALADGGAPAAGVDYRIGELVART